MEEQPVQEESQLHEEHESLPLVDAAKIEQFPTSKRANSVKFIIVLAALLVLLVALLFPLHRSSSISKSNGKHEHVVRDQTGFHFQPPRNWMNDPNGPVFYLGYYHLFYQYNPQAAVWEHGNLSWGHAVSQDLIHWKHLPLALEPSEWYDFRGVWSGSMTLVDNKPVILYTGISNESVQTQNAAVPEDPSDALLRRWRKIQQNPLIPSPPPGIGSMDFRDPSSAWRDKSGEWRIVIGGKNGSQGIGFVYTSSDFVSWKKAAEPMFIAQGTGMLECPDFFPVSDSKHIFKASLGDPDIIPGGFEGLFDTYTVGSYSNGVFIPDSWSNDSRVLQVGLGARVDHGNRFYAAKSFADPAKNRRVLWAWVGEADSRQEDVAKGWASIQTIPRSIWLDEAGQELMQLPVEEVKSLRIQPGVQKQNLSLEPGALTRIAQAGGDQLDVELVFQVPDLSAQMSVENFDVEGSPSGNAAEHCKNRGAVKGILGPFGLLVLASADRQEQTALFIHLGRSRRGLVALVCADHSKSSLKKYEKAAAAEKATSFHGAFVHLVEPSMSDATEDEELAIRVLVDHSVVETFAEGGRISITSRVYPKLARGNAANLFLFNNGTSLVRVKRLNAWKMRTMHFSQAD